MIKLSIDNSVCMLSGLDRPTFNALRKELRIVERTQATLFLMAKYRKLKKVGSISPKFLAEMKDLLRKVKASIRVKYFITERGVFPTGLLYIVLNFLEENTLEWETDDKRVRPQTGLESINADLSELIPYPEQLEAAQAVLRHSRGMVVAPTGLGKSLIASLICDVLKVKTLIVVTTPGLKMQLMKDMQGLFGKDKVGPLDKKGQPTALISIENIDNRSLKHSPKGVHLLIIDEFHHSGAKTYRSLNEKAWNKIYFKVGLTATPFRSKSTEKFLLESVLSQVIYRIEYQLAVEKKYIVPMEAYYYELPEIVPKGDTRHYAAMYSELVVNREDRNKLIADLADNLEAAGLSALILVKQIEHGVNIQKLTTLNIPFVKGENKDNREKILEFNLRETNSLIGTTGVLGEGVDTKPCEWVIIAGGGKSKNQFMQNVGRAFRNYPGKDSCKIVLIKDSSHAWFEKHYNESVRYLEEEYNIIPTKLDFYGAL